MGPNDKANLNFTEEYWLIKGGRDDKLENHYSATSNEITD